MFFTIESVKAVIIDLDSFAQHPNILAAVLQKTEHLRRAFVQKTANDTGTSYGLDSDEIFAASSPLEWSLFQNVIRRASTARQLKRSSTVLLTMDPGDALIAAQQLLLGTILISPANQQNRYDAEIYRHGPDFVISGAEQLEQILDGRLAGFIAEAFASYGMNLFPIKLKKPASWIACSIENRAFPEAPIWAGGRYFDKTGDPRYPFHPLSLRIINSKKYPERQAKSFAGTYGLLILEATRGQFDWITRVPARPDQPDRLAMFAKQIVLTERIQKWGIGPDRVREDILTCSRDYGSIKGLKAVGRLSAVKGAFEAGAEVRGKTIVVLDDVYTTGSTINECVKTLLEAGAAKVVPIVLGYHPISKINLGAISPDCLKCRCGGSLVPRFKTDGGEPFYGCENFLQGGPHDTKPLATGGRKRLLEAESLLLQLDPELDFDPLDF